MTQNPSDSIYGYIMRDETILCSIYAKDPDESHSTGFCEVNVELAAGDQIYVKGRGFFNGHVEGFTGFNGMFISRTE